MRRLCHSLNSTPGPRIVRKPPTEKLRVLVLCLPGIGDALMAVPMVTSLKAIWPQATVSALTMFHGARDLLALEPAFDEVIHFDFLAKGILRSLRFVWGLRKRRFHVCILAYPSNRVEYNLIAKLLDAPIRVGHRYRHHNVRSGNWLNTLTIEERDEVSNVEENLRLVQILTGIQPQMHPLSLVLPHESREAAHQWLMQHGVQKSLLIGIHPGGSVAKNHVNKRWPSDKFVELCKRLIVRLGCKILIFGGPEEKSLKSIIAEQVGQDALSVDEESIVRAAALVECCTYFISNDSSLMHVAGALGIPTTAIFGPTSIVAVRLPGSPRIEVSRKMPCQPCFYYSPRPLSCALDGFACIKELGVEQVEQSVLCNIHYCDKAPPRSKA